MHEHRHFAGRAIAFEIGDSVQAAEQSDQAIATFESFEQRYPKSTDLAQAKLEHARTLYRQGHYDRAEAILEPLAAGSRGAPKRRWAKHGN